MESSSSPPPSFGTRLQLAWRVVVDAAFAGRLLAPAPTAPPPSRVPAPIPTPAPVPTPAPPAPSPERQHASGLVLLAALQREGRLVDFLQQDVTAFADEDVAAAARVVHAGCQRLLRQVLDLEPAVPQAEGDATTLASGFDAQRIRLTGNVTGQPPYRGTVRHHGWVAKAVRFPTLAEGLDPRIVAAAEVELS